MSAVMQRRLLNLALGVLLAAGLILGVKLIFEQTQPATEVHAPAGQIG